MRISPSAFQRKPFRVHSFLADVPLHDVWVIKLPGSGDGRTVSDLVSLFSDTGRKDLNPAVRSLFALRFVLGHLFRWDRETEEAYRHSYLSRVTDGDRARSLDDPGSRRGSFRTLYRFQYEYLSEIINRTVHAFLCFAMEPSEDGYIAYWAIYVKPVNRLTPLYMALIDPFRRWLVYPAIIRRLEREWTKG